MIYSIHIHCVAALIDDNHNQPYMVNVLRKREQYENENEQIVEIDLLGGPVT